MKKSPGFTLLELLVVITLIALTSTIAMMSTGFLDKLNSENILPYESVISYLGEESSFKQKKVAWFVGDNTQSVKFLVKNNWQEAENIGFTLPKINPEVIFTDMSGSSFTILESRIDPFMTFDPVGMSSGGIIEFNDENKTVLFISQSLQYRYQ